MARNKLLDLKFPTLIWYPCLRSSDPRRSQTFFQRQSCFSDREIKCDVMNFRLIVCCLLREVRETKSTIKTDSLDLWMLIEKIFLNEMLASPCFYFAQDSLAACLLWSGCLYLKKLPKISEIERRFEMVTDSQVDLHRWAAQRAFDVSVSLPLCEYYVLTLKFLLAATLAAKHRRNEFLRSWLCYKTVSCFQALWFQRQQT